MNNFDVAIVGGGIVGLATAYQLTQLRPAARVVVVEKESGVAMHQTGHNSGVLHSGIYYRPGSLKAENCRLGKIAMEQFCTEHGIDFDVCGKVIVAVNDAELERLERIFQRGQQNQVKCELIEKPRLDELEPHTAGIKAIHVPEAGIINFRQVCLKLADLVRARDGEIMTSARVSRIESRPGEVIVHSTLGEIQARFGVNCAGLHCDRVARQSGVTPEAKILPFRGEYYKLKPEFQYLCRNLIYPVPDPSFPFLGVHFTRMIDGSVECGPNAVLAFAREGYRKTNVNIRDLAETIGYVGFRRLALKYWRVGLDELHRSFSKRAFVRALQRLIPEIRHEHIVSAPAGVRAQAISRDGEMVDDFVIERSGPVIHVHNAPSPAATSSLNIGRLVADKFVGDL